MKLLFSLFLAGVVVLLVLYGIPADLKDRGLALFGRAKIIPLEIQNEIESFILTPEEKREKLINQIQNNLTQLKSVPTNNADTITTTTEIIKETERIIVELREQNNDKPGVVDRVVQTVINQVLPQEQTKTESKINGNCPPQ